MKKRISIRKMVLCAIFAAEEPGRSATRLLKLNEEMVSCG